MSNIIEKASHIDRLSARWKRLEKISYELHKQPELVQILLSAAMIRGYINGEHERVVTSC